MAKAHDLAAFLESAKQCGWSRVRVLSPRGYELVRAQLAQLDAEGIEARVTTDAAPLPARSHHEYIVIVEDESGQGTDRHTLRVRGGEHPRDDGEHIVEPTQVTKPDQAKVTFAVNESKSHNEFFVITQQYTSKTYGTWYVAKSITMPMELVFDVSKALADFLAKEYL